LEAIAFPLFQAGLQLLPVLPAGIGHVACIESGTRVDLSGDVRRAIHWHEIGLIRHRVPAHRHAQAQQRTEESGANQNKNYSINLNVCLTIGLRKRDLRMGFLTDGRR
jgi:hypothetical protein